MKKQDFEHIIKSQNAEQDNGEFWWLDNVEYRFDNAYEKMVKFINKINNILQSDDKTLKKALKFSIANDYELFDFSNSIFDKHDYNLSFGESSIETLFYNAFQYIRNFDKKNREEYILFPQQEIEIDNKLYRVDFMLINYLNDKKIVIECDGYEYHSSKEQIVKDNQRQRDLENAGYIVIRFLGTEIFNNPINCVYDVYKRANLFDMGESNE